MKVTLPLEATGLGVPVGPAVMVTTSGTASTWAVHVAAAVSPNPSLAVTVSVQACCAPVRLTGAVHAGFCAVALGANNPVLGALIEMVASLHYEQRRVTVERARELLRETADMHRRALSLFFGGLRGLGEAEVLVHRRAGRFGVAQADGLVDPAVPACP